MCSQDMGEENCISFHGASDCVLSHPSVGEKDNRYSSGDLITLCAQGLREGDKKNTSLFGVFYQLPPPN